MKWKGRPKSKNVVRGENYNNYPKTGRSRATEYESSKVALRKKLAERAKVKPKGPKKRSEPGQNLIRHMRKTPLK